MSTRMVVEAQSEAIWGELMARMVVRESPSRMMEVLLKREVRCTTRMAAFAFPWFASIEGKP